MNYESNYSLNEGPSVPLPEGFPFNERSAIRQHAEPASFLLYPAAAAYMAADPALAMGVSEHSDFRNMPLGRLKRTADAAIDLVFGNEQESLAVARRLHTFHQTIAGETNGIEYSANDSRLQAWVLVCLQKVAYDKTMQRWIDPNWGVSDASKQAREQLWSDIKTFGEFFGIKRQALPATIAELDEYWEYRLTDGSLLQTPLSRALTREVTTFSNPRVPAWAARIGRAVTLTSLDPRMHQMLDLHPTDTDLRTADKTDSFMRRNYRILPHAVRESAIPGYLAVRRVLASF